MRTFLIKDGTVSILGDLEKNLPIIASIPVSPDGSWKDVVVEILFAPKLNRRNRDVIGLLEHNANSIKRDSIELFSEMSNYWTNYLKGEMEDDTERGEDLRDLLRKRGV